MKKLMTKEYVNQIQFFQMPKAFFQLEKYMTMRTESKVAYMLLLDLVRLSAANNWVNEKNEIHVKLSRTRLMSLLNIKSTHKAAQVMKELVDYGLILNKKMGLNKCNQIYLYPVDSSENKTQEEKTDLASPPPEANVLEKDMATVESLLENQIHIEDLRQKYGPGLVDEIGNNIFDMFLNTTTPIGQQNIPMSIMRRMIGQLQMYHIEHVVDQFKEATTRSEIIRPKKYLQTLIYNSVCEAQAKITGSIGYHMGF